MATKEIDDIVMNNRKLASLIASSNQYRGGYLYQGMHAYHQEQGLNLSVRQYGEGRDQRTRQEMAARNKRILNEAKIGDHVVTREELVNENAYVVYEKTGPCKWIIVEKEFHDLTGEPNDRRIETD